MNLKSARQQLGLSVRGLADLLGMNVRSVQRMEAGTQPISDRTAKQIEFLLRHSTREPAGA